MHNNESVDGSNKSSTSNEPNSISTLNITAAVGNTGLLFFFRFGIKEQSLHRSVNATTGKLYVS